MRRPPFCQVVACLCAVLCMPFGLAAGEADAADAGLSVESGACFILFQRGVGEIRRSPSTVCRTRVSPASTFKIPHALAALDAGAVASIDEKLAYDGAGSWPISSRRDHTLASAVRHSVVWYFQAVALRLGAEREREYLRRFAYGNMDSSSGLKTFWLGGSLEITPEEQLAFLARLYDDSLPVSAKATRNVKAILVQGEGIVWNAFGPQAFNGPWPDDALVSAKTGSTTDASGRGVRWLVGQVRRGTREFVFVSCVVGEPAMAATAAIVLAARSLREEGVL
jgi:beta-lactamase class D